LFFAHQFVYFNNQPLNVKEKIPYPSPLFCVFCIKIQARFVNSSGSSFLKIRKDKIDKIDKIGKFLIFYQVFLMINVVLTDIIDRLFCQVAPYKEE
jgi:uncharacterized membrane protein